MAIVENHMDAKGCKSLERQESECVDFKWNVSGELLFLLRDMLRYVVA